MSKFIQKYKFLIAKSKYSLIKADILSLAIDFIIASFFIQLSY